MELRNSKYDWGKNSLANLNIDPEPFAGYKATFIDGHDYTRVEKPHEGKSSGLLFLSQVFHMASWLLWNL